MAGGGAGMESGKKRCGGARSLLICPIDPYGSCGGSKGDQRGPGSPEARNRGGELTYPRRRPARFRPLQVPWLKMVAVKRFQASRRCFYTALVGLGCAEVAWWRIARVLGLDVVVR